MKLTALMILGTLMQLSASIYSQTKLSLKINNTSIESALKEIENQSEYFFQYNNQQIDVTKKIDIDVADKSIEDVLKNLLKETDIHYLIKDRQIVLYNGEPNSITNSYGTTMVSQQQKSISGKVTDSNQNPLPGVTIVVKGTTIGIITDADGNYNLDNLPANATLIFSFVGMKAQEVPVAGESVIDITLQEETIGLDEVVAVGYGSQKKANLVGAVSAVRIDEKITSRSLSNVSSALQGLIPGLSVNQNSGMAGNNSAELLIRGIGTVNNSAPLIIVDGMPDVDINRINLNDIESISVLKDAVSSAVYGSRAANGVILITTKSGKGQTKTNISVSGSYAVEHPTKAYEFMDNYPRALTVHQRAASVNTLPSNLTYKNGTIDQWLALGMIDPIKYPNTDWWNLIMRNGEVQNYNISAVGGNEKSNFFLSMGILDEKGLQINNDYKRYNARLNYDAKIRSNINVGARFAGNWSKYQFAYGQGFTSGSDLDLYAAIAGILPYDPTTGNYGGVMAYNENTQAFNPYTVFVNNLFHQDRQEANLNAFLDWIPVKGLTARVEYALTYYNQFRYQANTPNRAYNFQTETFGPRIYVQENAPISNYTWTGYKTLLTGRLNYDKIIAVNHQVNLMFAYSEEYWHDRYQMSQRYNRLYPSLHEIDAALTDIQSTGGNSNNEGLRSYIGRLNYSAFDKYLVEFNFRYDGSSRFLPGHQYGFFPSAAVGWRFKEEEFINSFTGDWLSNGKLRFSYGSLGNNSGVGRYEQQETLSASNYMVNGAIVKGFVNKKMVNQDLSWEETKVMNVGLDFGFWSKLTMEIDYYDRLTTGMNRPSDMSILLTGAYTAPRRNIGDLRNRGIEGNFIWREKRGEFDYMINTNISYNTTKLEKWNEFLGRGSTFIDMPYQFLYTYVDEGIAQTWEDVYNATPQGASPGDILRKDLNGDGRIDDNDRKAYPHIQRNRPTTNFALNASVAWKGFDLSMLWQGAAGRKDYWLNNYNDVNFANTHYASSWDHWYEPWSVENRDGEWPRLNGSNNKVETTFWLDDMSYLRLKNLQIGYMVPSGFLQKLGLTSTRVYGSVENLVTFTNYRGLDPEKITYANEAYPINKIFSVGINIEL